MDEKTRREVVAVLKRQGRSDLAEQVTAADKFTAYHRARHDLEEVQKAAYSYLLQGRKQWDDFYAQKQNEEKRNPAAQKSFEKAAKEFEKAAKLARTLAQQALETYRSL